MASPNADIGTESSNNGPDNSLPAIIRDRDHVTKYLRSETDLTEMTDLESLGNSLQALGSHESDTSSASRLFLPSTPNTHRAESTTTPHTGYSESSNRKGIGAGGNNSSSLGSDRASEVHEIAGLGAWFSNDSALDRPEHSIDITEADDIGPKGERPVTEADLSGDDGESRANIEEQRDVGNTIQGTSCLNESLVSVASQEGSTSGPPQSPASENEIDNAPSPVQPDAPHNGTASSASISIHEPPASPTLNAREEGTGFLRRRRMRSAIHVTVAQNRLRRGSQRSRSSTELSENPQASVTGQDLRQHANPSAQAVHLTADVEAAYVNELPPAHIGINSREFPTNSDNYQDLELGAAERNQRGSVSPYSSPSSSLFSADNRSHARQAVLLGLFSCLVIPGLLCAVIAAAQHNHLKEALMILFLDGVVSMISAVCLTRFSRWPSCKVQVVVAIVVAVLFLAIAILLGKMYPSHKEMAFKDRPDSPWLPMN